VPVAAYMFRTWNAQHSGSEQISQLEFIYCMELQDVKTGLMKTSRERLAVVPPDAGKLPADFR